MDAVTMMRESMDRLRGQLFQFHEAVGMPRKQEDAVKGLIRRLTYDAQARLETAIRSERPDGRPDRPPGLAREGEAPHAYREPTDRRGTSHGTNITVRDE